jgi:1-acyl-sn-glycerol-3-phosphate acyltransferase
MILIRSVLFAIIFYTGTALEVLAALYATRRGPDLVRPHALRWARFHSWCCRHILRVESRVEGEVPHGAVLIASKHQSMYETLELVRIIHEPAIVLKAELAAMPLWGRIAREYGAIPITREGSAGALRSMLRAAKVAVAQHRPILIFPEGTRVTPGDQPPLKSGFAGLYSRLKIPVIPIALDSGKVWGRQAFLKRPGVVTFRFGDPIPPGLTRAEIEERVHAAINVLDTKV